MEKRPPPALPPAPKEEQPPVPSDSAEAAQHREGASEIGDRVRPDEEAAPDPDVGG